MGIEEWIRRMEWQERAYRVIITAASLAIGFTAGFAACVFL